MAKRTGNHLNRGWVTPVLIGGLALALGVSLIVIGVLIRDLREARTEPTGSSVPVYGEDGRPVEGPVQKNDGTISAPGYEMLEIKAGVRAQGFALANPVQNSCYMKISLSLEDGTVLWTSRPTAPGEATDEVILTKTLSEGRYDGAKILYDCYRDKACTEELNDVVIELYLLAKANK